MTKSNWQHVMVVYWCQEQFWDPKLSRTGPAVTGCQQLQEERLRGALGYEKDTAHFTFSWLYFLWLCGNVTFSHHMLDSNRQSDGFVSHMDLRRRSAHLMVVWNWPFLKTNQNKCLLLRVRLSLHSDQVSLCLPWLVFQTLFRVHSVLLGYVKFYIFYSFNQLYQLILTTEFLSALNSMKMTINVNSDKQQSLMSTY